MHRCNTDNNASNINSSVNPGTSTSNAQIGVTKVERKQATRSSPFFPCFSRNESDQSESESDNCGACQQALTTTTPNTVLRSSSANSFLSPLETDFIGSDSDFNFDDDPPLN
uniref:Uncharacterized protein n=1 Tax=Ditylenchus dipsaci TaxID=166011 RepID=A0A915CRB0_9BILA